MEDRFYFRQLLSGVHLGKNEPAALQMANFIYLIGDQKTRECLVVDPAWDIDGLLEFLSEEDMKLTGEACTNISGCSSKVVPRNPSIVGW